LSTLNLIFYLLILVQDQIPLSVALLPNQIHYLFRSLWVAFSTI
jgi:hypothetical protein